MSHSSAYCHCPSSVVLSPVSVCDAAEQLYSFCMHPGSCDGDVADGNVADVDRYHFLTNPNLVFAAAYAHVTSECICLKEYLCLPQSCGSRA